MAASRPSDEEQQEWISKSELKREAEELQKIGNEIVALGKGDLAKIPMDEELELAVALALRLKGKNEAHRRQLQFIGKLLRFRDVEPIREALDKIRNKHNQASQHFHKMEQWRDRLIAEGDDAIQALFAECPEMESERQRVRQLVRQANKEAKTSKLPKASRELFKLIREHLEDKL
ncbi:ribosome biogenesis factor YjgA [Ferrimonas aestuarii]|uniref:Dual-action ribosomal maturation protein DarP n=1 Tax=Ferrimonas aestuarii TaxID=2569539 RepID=A0A4U1BPE1_9GAMM|nr:ribosome biogenesis factor YjgA [Ferrimonas aestuarii]TKB55974.1 ribosome-associated protein [Ferrimonas aestuarii]